MPSVKRYSALRAWGFLHRAGCAVFTALMRRQFGSWGKGSTLHFPAKLIAPHLVCVGDRVTISAHAWVNAKDSRGDGNPTLMIGDGTYIGRFVQINAWQQVVIENEVLIADRVFITDADHNYENTNIPILLQGDSFKGRVVLREGCFLGIGAVVLPGITVGKNAVVAANAVVTSDVPDYAVVGGIPARVLKSLA